MIPGAAIAVAASLARQTGKAQYIVPALDPDTGEALPSIVEDEPNFDHVRVEKDGSATLVYWPTQVQ